MREGTDMKELMERQWYNPWVVLPLIALMELLVSADFNLGRVSFAVATKGARVALNGSREFMGIRHRPGVHATLH